MQIRSVVIIAALGLASFAHGQSAAVQWRVEDGGNGHWYRIVRGRAYICWHDAKLAAELSGGHLATIGGHSEDTFIKAVVASLPGVSASEYGPWLGLACVGVPWGEWYWVTGEPVSFSAWPGWAPNPGWGEESLHLWRYGTPAWNDYHDCGTGVFSYMTEWSADCNGDGIVDYGQILDGTFADINENGVPDTCEIDPCPGDITGGGQVNGVDLAAILGAWGTDGQGKLDCDINDDGTVDAQDLAIVLGGWGNCP